VLRGIETTAAGPLAGHIESVCEELVLAGWRPATVESHRRLLGRLSRWVAEEHAGGALSEELVVEFFRLRREAGFTVRFSTTGMAPVLDRLRARGLITSSEGRDGGLARCQGSDVETDPILAAYIRYMGVERRFARQTIQSRWEAARRFWRFVDGVVDGIDADAVTRFLLGEVSRLKPSGAAKVGDGVRAFLRFLFATGVMGRDLSALALTVRAKRTSPLPKTVDAAAVRAILDSCDGSIPMGLRDFAILTVMVRLGLRASEVAALVLDDIDWRAAELVVHGKGRRTERMPLPADVGEAIAAWLSGGRPGCDTRAVFVNVRTRFGHPMTAEAVGRVSARASRRAGCAERVGSHRLRHTAATEMLRAGATLREVAQVLRHSSESTTAIYAKVDRAALQICLQPWPGADR
jgi:site-specific recombinase XerD